jgi:D-serine dehydratase
LAAEHDPAAYFIDDENSLPLLFGYATAIGELQRQLAAESVKVW